MPPVLAAQIDPVRLKRRLVEAFGRDASRRVVIGLRSARATSYIGGNDHNACAVVRTGCLTKLLTAELTRNVAAEGLFDLEDDAAGLLGDARPGSRGVTVEQLLEHTHGLDSCLDRVPLRPSGLIDRRRLLAACRSSPRIARPGRVYCYGDLGPWLAAAVLERVTGRRYVALLRERLLARWRAAMRVRGAGAIDGLPKAPCPSRGGPLALTCEAMLDVLSCAAFARAGTTFDEAADSGAITPMPGWSVLERGVFAGWKYYGEAWFGHNSTWPGAEALVRVNAGRHIALVVSSSGPPALVVAAKVLGSLLPELRTLRVPRPAGAPRARCAEASRIVGTYASAAETITIAAGGDGLRLTASPRAGRNGEPGPAVRLHSAGGGLLLTVPALARLPFVQAVEVPGESDLYLWNGQRVWRRVASLVERSRQRV